ncbi:MAG: glutamate synthase [Christensenellaceae bacterium]
MIIDTNGLDYKALNEKILLSDGECVLENCIGQRFIGAGMNDKSITIHGVPGNALGAYLNGASIEVYGNAQDAVGDTMNEGRIVVHGDIGDAVGYAMRGGEIFVKGSAGYRAGIHMKEYGSKVPNMVIGGSCGSFLGEYQAGGVIVVLGLSGKRIVGDFPCTGMHGGKIYMRVTGDEIDFPSQVTCSPATDEELEQIKGFVEKYCRYFGGDASSIMSSNFVTVKPNSKNPYKQMYVAN